MRHLNKLALTIAAAALLSACSKKSSSTNSNNNNTGNGGLNSMEQALVGKWTIQSEINYNYPTGGDSVNYNELDSCQMDDVYTFASDRTFTIDDGPTKCTITTTTGPFAWKIDTSDSTFTFIGGPSIASTYPKILQLDNTTLKTYYRLSNNAENSVLVCIYKKKS